VNPVKQAQLGELGGGAGGVASKMFDVSRYFGGGGRAEAGDGASQSVTQSVSTPPTIVDAAGRANNLSATGEGGADGTTARRLDSPTPPGPVQAPSALPAADLFTVDFGRPSDQYEVAKRMSTIFEHEGMTEVVRGAKRIRVPRPKPQPRPRVVGPPVPDIGKAIKLSGKTPESVASEMGVPVKQLEEMMNKKDPSVSQWAPVLAKCTRIARVGLLKLVSRKCPCGCSSAGHHIFLTLTRAGESTLSKARSHLTQGWDGWKEHRLTDALVNKFFAGQSKEAERVADVLYRLANATDSTNIFCIFVE